MSDTANECYALVPSRFSTFMRTPLTDDQARDLRSCFYAWEQIRRENGYDSTPTGIDIEKSCLLGRMTMEGKPPLPTPPPTAYAAPWYALIENGRADLLRHDVWGPTDLDGATVMGICHTAWNVVRLGDPSGYVITHEKAAGEWVLRHRTESDPQVRAGTRRQSDGSWTPFYADADDWVLEQQPSHNAREGS